jgi:hypothetical protein
MAPQYLYETWKGEDDVHPGRGAAREATRSPATRPPERNPRRALLILQHGDASAELHKAEEELIALNARKQGLNPPTVAERFTLIYKKVKLRRDRVLEIEQELGDGAGPSEAGPNVELRRAEEELAALNARKQDLDPCVVAEQFTQIYNRIRYQRARVLETHQGLAGGTGPGAAGPAIAGRGSAGPITDSGGGARPSCGRRYPRPPYGGDASNQGFR